MPRSQLIDDPVPFQTTDLRTRVERSYPPLCDAFTVGVRDGILWVRWNRSVTVSAEDAARLVRRVDALCLKTTPPMLVELNGMVSLSRGALHIFATELNITAMAIFGPSAVDETLATFFIQVHKPPYPAAFFAAGPPALAWLTGHVGSA
jgi:hypothetical protein